MGPARNAFTAIAVILIFTLAGVQASSEAFAFDAADESGGRPGVVAFYVSPRGNDAWSGRLSDPNTTDGPFATLERSRDAIRTLRRTQNSQIPVRVTMSRRDVLSRLAAGVWAPGFGDRAGSGGVRCGGRRKSGSERGTPFGERSLGRGQRSQSLGGGHSGGEGRDVAFSATLRQWRTPAANEAAEAGGIPHRVAAGLYGRLSQESDEAIRLCPGRHRADLAQSAGRGRRGDHAVAGQSAADRKRQRLDSDSHIRPRSLFALVSSATSGDGTAIPSVYWVENVLEAMDTPGQWYLDRPGGVLYYLPRPGEEMPSAEIIAPRLTQVLRVVGREGAPVHDLRFEGLTFAHTEWQPPADYASSLQAGIEVPGALLFDYAERCAVTGGRIEHIGNSASRWAWAARISRSPATGSRTSARAESASATSSHGRPMDRAN